MQRTGRQWTILISYAVSASLLLGLGLYGKFAAKGNAFHPLLNDANTVNALLVLGGLGMMWGAYQVMTLRRQKP